MELVDQINSQFLNLLGDDVFEYDQARVRISCFNSSEFSKDIAALI